MSDNKIVSRDGKPFRFENHRTVAEWNSQEQADSMQPGTWPATIRPGNWRPTATSSAQKNANKR